MKGRSLVLALMMLVMARKAHATPELYGLFDARSTGMGATGVAFLDSAGAIPLNPALLDQVDKLVVTLDATVFRLKSDLPYPIARLSPSGERTQGFQQVSSERVWAVNPFGGFGYRLFERVVVGAATYPILAQGDTEVRYRPAPDELPGLEVATKGAIVLLEGSLPVSIRLLDNLSVGLSWRFTYLVQSATATLPGGPPSGLLLDATGNPVYADVDISGANFAGLQLGVFYKSAPFLRLGLSYRSKVVVDGTGTTSLNVPGAPR